MVTKIVKKQRRQVFDKSKTCDLKFEKIILVDQLHYNNIFFTLKTNIHLNRLHRTVPTDKIHILCKNMEIFLMHEGSKTAAKIILFFNYYTSNKFWL